LYANLASWHRAEITIQRNAISNKKESCGEEDWTKKKHLKIETNIVKTTDIMNVGKKENVEKAASPFEKKVYGKANRKNIFLP